MRSRLKPQQKKHPLGAFLGNFELSLGNFCQILINHRVALGQGNEGLARMFLLHVFLNHLGRPHAFHFGSGLIATSGLNFHGVTALTGH